MHNHGRDSASPSADAADGLVGKAISTREIVNAGVPPKGAASRGPTASRAGRGVSSRSQGAKSVNGGADFWLNFAERRPSHGHGIDSRRVFAGVGDLIRVAKALCRGAPR